MTGLTQEKNLSKFETGAQNIVRKVTVEAGKTILKGMMVVLNSTGKAEPAELSTTANHVVGVAMASASNGEGLLIESGIFAFELSAVSEKDTDTFVFVKDNATIQTGATSSVVAGVFRFLTEDGLAAVEVGNIIKS